MSKKEADYSADTETTGIIVPGTFIESKIDTKGDVDWFKVYLMKGRVYTINLMGDSSDSGTLKDPYLRGVYNSNGDYISGTANDDGGKDLDAQLEFVPEASGEYYIGVDTLRPSDDDGESEARGMHFPLIKMLGIGKEWKRSLVLGTGTYKLLVTDDDYGDDKETLGRVAPGSSIKGEITATNDIDWIKVSLTEGKTYRIEIKGYASGHGTLRNPYLRGVYDSSGQLIDGTTSDGGGLRFDATYFDWEHASAGDRFKIVQQYTSGPGEWLIFGMPTGNVLNQRCYDIGDDAVLEFTPKTSGDYYIAIDSQLDPKGKKDEVDTDDYHSYGGTYQLFVADDDYSSNTKTTGEITPGSSARGKISGHDDIDWFKVSLTAGETYNIDFKGSSSRDGSLSNPYFRGVYDSNGNLISGTTDNDGGKGDNARIEFTPETTGVYYLAVDSTSDGEAEKYKPTFGTFFTGNDKGDYFFAGDGETGYTGTYELSIMVSIVEHIEPGSSFHGEIVTDRDTNWVKVTLEGGTPYVIDIKGYSTGDGTLADPCLDGIYDSRRNLISGTTDDNGGEGDNAQLRFSPETTGDYYIVVGTHDGKTGSYSLSVEKFEGFTPDLDTPGRVWVGSHVHGELESASRTVWIKVELEEGKVYKIDLRGAATGDGTLVDPRICGIYDSRGDVIDGTTDDNGGTGKNSKIEFYADTAGYYYIEVGAGSETEGGTYDLSIDETSDDYPTNPTTGGYLSMDKPGWASIAGYIGKSSYPWGDQDWIRVTLTKGKNYKIAVKGYPTRDGTLEDPYLQGIYDSDGHYISGTTNDDGGEGVNAAISFTPKATGDYYINADAHGHATGSYTVYVLNDDYRADPETTGKIAPGSSVKGELTTTSDRDWFKITLTANKTYHIKAEGSYILGVYIDEGEMVFDATGVIYRAEPRRLGYSPTLDFTPETSGDYYIATCYWTYDLARRMYNTHDPGAYELSVTDDDYSADTETTGRIDSGSSLTGEITVAGEMDWFKITLTAGTNYVISLKGKPTGNGTLDRPYLRGVYDSSGHYIRATTGDNEWNGYDAEVEFTPGVTGDYYICVDAHGGDTGTYELSVEDNDDYSASPETQWRIEPGSSVTGKISTGSDIDWFRVTLTEGKDYRIDIKGSATGDGTLGDPYLRGVYDSSGHLIDGTTSNNGGVGLNARLEFTPETSGEYFIAVDSAGIDASDYMGTYELSIVDDDYRSNTETTGRVDPGSSVTGEITGDTDIDWFKVTLTAGINYAIDIKGEPSGSGTLDDPYLRGVYDSDGDYISGTTNDDGGSGYNARLEFTPEASGDYYIAVDSCGDIDDYGSYTGTYELSVGWFA